MHGGSSGIQVWSTQSLDVGPEDTSSHPGRHPPSPQPPRTQRTAGGGSALQVAPRDAEGRAWSAEGHCRRWGWSGGAETDGTAWGVRLTSAPFNRRWPTAARCWAPDRGDWALRGPQAWQELAAQRDSTVRLLGEVSNSTRGLRSLRGPGAGVAGMRVGIQDPERHPHFWGQPAEKHKQGLGQHVHPHIAAAWRPAAKRYKRATYASTDA